MMSEKLPNGWVETTLGEVAVPSREHVLPSEVPDMPYVGLEHIEPHTMRLLGQGQAGDVRSSSLRFSTGDILYGRMRPYLNKVWIAEFDGLCSPEFLVFPRRDGLRNEFFAARLNAEDFVTYANQQVSGERPRVDFEKLSRFPLWLPPTEEQERITAKLITALHSLQRAEMAATRARAKLPGYRTAVLNSAFTGELTHAWRETMRKRKNGKIETGEALLLRFFAARGSDEVQLDLEGFSAKTPDALAEASSLRAITTDPPSLPETWACASLKAIAEIGSGISVSQSRRLEDPIAIPYLRVANVLRGRLDLTEVKTIRVERNRVSDYLLRPGDVLFTEGGDRDKLGRGWIWEGQLPECVHQNHVFRVRLYDPSLVNPRLVSHWGNTFGQAFFIEHGKQTTNLASINRSVLGQLPVPIPPREEQTELLTEINRRLVAADKLEQTLDKQLAAAHAARQSLLREAFFGRLVPQDPKDEPASAALERLRAARNTELRKQGAKIMKKATSKIKRERLGLLEVLREHDKAITPEQLFEESGYQQEFDEDDSSQEVVDGFYEELRHLIGPQGPVFEQRPDRNTVLLKAKP